MDHRIRAFWARVLPACLLLFGTSSCIVFGKQQGVKNTWRATDVAFEEGVTTQAQVAEALGPPSQILGLEGQTIFYYVRERSDGRGIVLLIYNQIRQKVDYDRAVFFFDAEGVLTSSSFSEVAFPVDGKK